MRKKNGKLFKSDTCNNSNNKINKTCENFEKNKSSNKILDNEDNKKERRISLKCPGIFTKRAFLRCKSLEKDIDKLENKIKIKNNLKANLIYKRNNKILSRTSSNGYKHYLTLENNSLSSANSISNINSNIYEYDKNNFLKTFLKEKKINSIIGREIDDNFDEQNEIIEEDNNENDEKEKGKDNIIDEEIKKLIKERDDEINNIIVKYQDKMNKMKKGQNKND